MKLFEIGKEIKMLRKDKDITQDQLARIAGISRVTLGRATRSEYWYFILFYVLISIALQLLDTFVINPMLGMTATEAAQGGFAQVLFSLALLLPLIAIGIRRLHDTNKSGWWMLLALIPILGSLVLLFFFVQESQ